MKLHRKTTVRLRHSLRYRTTIRLNSGPRTRLPNHVPVILCALRRYIRLHRRLMKLAPEMFDHAIAMKLRQEHEEREQRRREIEPLLLKVYGPAEQNPARPPDHSLSQPKPLSPRKLERVENLSREKALWMSIAQNAINQLENQARLPLLRLSAIGGLLKVGITIGRIATGLETNLKVDPHAHLYRRDMNADLERIYGNEITDEQTDLNQD